MVFLRVVDLQPSVDETFFFSKQDPQVRIDNEIVRTFPQSRQIILAAAGDIRSPGYAERVRALSDELAALPGVSGVESLSRGPNDIDDALESPLWSRLLISTDRHSTYGSAVVLQAGRRHPDRTRVCRPERRQQPAQTRGGRPTPRTTQQQRSLSSALDAAAIAGARPSRGSVVSIATVLGEAKRPFIANFLSTEKLIEISRQPEIRRGLAAADQPRPQQNPVRAPHAGDHAEDTAQ